MNIKKAHIDSINLMSEGFEDLFENDNYHIEIIKAKGIYSPSRYKSEFGQKLKRNLAEVKVIHTSNGLSIPLKRLANNNLKQIIEFGGLSGYLERSQLLQEFFKNVSVEMEDALIIRIDICLDYSRIPSSAIKNLKENRIPFKFKNSMHISELPDSDADVVSKLIVTKSEKKINPYYDVKIYNHSLKNGLEAKVKRIEFCFKKSFIGDVRLRDIESIYPKMEKAILKASGLSVKIDNFF